MRVATDHGPEVLAWWLLVTSSSSPSNETLAAAIFAIGAPVAPGFAFESLQHDLTTAFAMAFAPFYESHVEKIREHCCYRRVSPAQGAPGPDASLEDDINDVPDEEEDDDEDDFDDYLGGPIHGL